MGVTIYNIAEKVNTSAATVSLALRGNSRISEATQTRIREVARKMGYQPNHLAKALRSGESKVLGLLVPGLFMELDPIENLADKAGYRVQILAHHSNLKRFETTLRDMLLRRVDGLLVLSPPAGGVEMIRKKDSNLPISISGEKLWKGEDSFVAPVHDATFQATEYFIGLNHTRIALLCNTTSEGTVQSRQAGYREAMEKHGLCVTENLLVDMAVEGHPAERGHDSMVDALKRWSPEERPTAILASNDEVAMGAITAIYEAGLSVPDDISMMGMMNLEISPYGRVPMTTVEYNAHEMRIRAMNRLLERVKSKKDLPVIESVAPVKIIERESCRKLSC